MYGLTAQFGLQQISKEPTHILAEPPCTSLHPNYHHHI